MTANYRFLDFFSGIHHTVKCEILEEGAKTTKIKLLEYGNRGAAPGTIMRVHNKSITKNDTTYESTSWHQYCYFD